MKNYVFVKYCQYLAIAFIVCAVGDILLIYNDQKLVIGIFVYMIAYYVLAWARHQSINFYFSIKRRAIINFVCWLVFFLMCAAAFSYIIYIINESSNFKLNKTAMTIVISLYASSIVYAGSMHFAYLLLTFNISAFMSFVGVMLFAVSDFLIIYNMVESNTLAINIAVIVIYWLALCLISWSAYSSGIQSMYQRLHTDHPDIYK